jgi:uncharacterized protein YlxW (UPF0749 family)|tara:strand:- start:38 stop:292 length:255 start_codon:yes stop_codon:yes gene_type:complete
MDKDIEVWTQRNEILHKKVERMMEESREKETALANALEVNESHQKLNGVLRTRMTELEEDNKKLAQQVEDYINRIKKIENNVKR